MEVNNSLKNIIIKNLPRFNESVRGYLKKNLTTMGENSVIAKINIHIASYVEDNTSGIIEQELPFALKYDSGQAEEAIGGSIEDIKSERWWREEAGISNAEESMLKICQKSVSNVVSDAQPGARKMVLVVEIKHQKHLREIYLAEVISDILKDYINDIIDLIEDNWIKKIGGSNSISLMERYVRKVFQKWKDYPVLTRENCCLLSYQKNEGRECVGRIYLGNEKGGQEQIKEAGKGIVCFQNAWNHMDKTGLSSKELENGEMRYIRKMMELCKKDKYLLTWFDKENSDKVDLFGLADEMWLAEHHYTRYIGFEKYGEWTLHESDEMILLYTNGNYYFSRQARDDAWKQKLKDKKMVGEENLDKFKKITSKLSEQEYGTCMIVLDENDIETEVKRLCKDCNRGTQIFGKLDLDEEGMGFLNGLTSVDGALLVDRNGACHAFGVILDGEATKQGNPAKGARHNSALTYISGKSRGAVIVSEDKTVQIEKLEMEMN